MLREKSFTIASFICFQILVSPVFAGSLRPIFFDSSEKQVSEDPADFKDLIISQGKVKNSCADDASKVCVDYDLIVPRGFNVSSFKTKVQAVMAILNSVPDIQLKLSVGGVREENEFFAPEEAAKNQNFIISLVAPNQEFKTSKTILKVFNTAFHEDGFSEITHSVIYLNTEGSSIDPSYVIANGIGQSLGLGVSAIRKSIMSDEAATLKSLSILSTDDIQWLSYLYGSSSAQNKLGALAGKIISGENKEAVIGAHIGVLEEKNINAFTDTLNRDLLAGSSFSDAKGNFVVPSLKRGSYVLVIEPRADIFQGISKFNPILDKLFSKLNFEAEFYDGKERESNHEAALGFSPRAIQFAAILNVDVAKATTGIEIITNIGDEKIEAFSAAGSTNETLSKIEATEKDFKASDEENDGPIASVGCNLVVPSTNLFGTFICLLIFALSLALMRRQDQRVK